jgi:GxxExxY protein
MKENQISYNIRGAAFKVYNELGPGLLESVYQTALSYELQEMGYQVDCQVSIPMKYKEIQFDNGFRMDIVINNCVVIEVKSVESLMDVHHKQLLTYLKLSGKKLGLLINFNVSSMNNSIIRIVNNL